MKEIATLIMVGVSCIISLFDEPSSEIDDINDISHIVDNAQFYPKGYVDTFKLHPMHFEKYKEEFEDDKKEKIYLILDCDELTAKIFKFFAPSATDRNIFDKLTRSDVNNGGDLNA